MKHVIMVMAAAGLATQAYAADSASTLNAQELGRLQSGAPAAAAPPAASSFWVGNDCPPGTHFVPQGYIKRGKWRPAGCR